MRWRGADGLMLRGLYPNFRFLVVVRHPVAAYHSRRNFGPAPARRRAWDPLDRAGGLP